MAVMFRLDMSGFASPNIVASTLHAARQALLRNIAVQMETGVTDRARGAAGAAAGSYPIPARTGAFLRGFTVQIGDTSVAIANDRVYARALHDGFQPYGNEDARPIPARPYFEDAAKAIDFARAQDAWWQAVNA
ncbi:hypothetical protein [Xanthomonas arboricola]|uniref:hypothetical protein n=1 Tax=Xanthomonas arboricola TaxID=56448 RepID=UPI0032E9179E